MELSRSSRSRVCAEWQLRGHFTASVVSSMDPVIRDNVVVRYRGFVLIPMVPTGWLVRPERSPMVVFPFRFPAASLDQLKAEIDGRLLDQSLAADQGFAA